MPTGEYEELVFGTACPCTNAIIQHLTIIHRSVSYRGEYIPASG